MIEFIRLFLKRFLFLLNMILALYTLLVYQLSYSVSVKHWLGGFLMLSLPLAFAGNVFFILIWALRKSPRIFVSIVILIIGFPLLLRTFTWHTTNDDDTRKGISVLSYNLMWCDIEGHSLKRDSINSTNLINTALGIDADIKCVQELFNVDYIPKFRMIQKLKKTHPHYTYVHATPGNDEGQGSIGLAIFSKYPIVRKEEKHWAINHNGLLSADIAINKDTIRVINVQLRSMGVRVHKVLDAGDDKEKAKKEAKTIYHQLKEGFNDRIIQMIELESWIKTSPYPVILVGDFNEVPYGYTYGRARKYLKNGFEEKGSGFGFTYHKSPGFLRIDNQFYDDRYFDIKSFKTYSDKPYSDHYPIWGEYILKK